MIAIGINVKEESKKGIVLKVFLSKGNRQEKLEETTKQEWIVSSSVLVEICNTLKTYCKETSNVDLDLKSL